MDEFAEFLEAKRQQDASAEDFAVDLEVTKDGATHKVAGVPWSKIPAATREALGLGEPDPEGDQGDGGKEGGSDGGKPAVLDYFRPGASAGRKASGGKQAAS
jgi:hypothetical protein